MAFTRLVHSTTADATVINQNFDHVAAGTRYPMTSVGADMAPTDSVYDLGSSANRWANVYCNTLNIYGSITTDNGSLMAKISEVTLSATTASISFTGLNGDAVTQFELLNYFICDTTTNVLMELNSDSASNYGYQEMYYQLPGVFSAVRGSSTAIVIGNCLGLTTTIEKSYSQVMLYSKTGNERLSNIQFCGTADTLIGYIAIKSAIYNNTSNTITSIQIYLSAGEFEPFTNILLRGRK